MKNTKHLYTIFIIMIILCTLPLYSNGNSRNNQPVLDDSYNPVLMSILEDVTTSSGTPVSEIIPPGSITDLDGVINSLAVIEVDNSNGMWQYSLNNGANWVNFSGIAGQNVAFPEQALLLSGQLSGEFTNKIRFIPNPDYPNENAWELNFNGEASLRYKAWDESYLSAGLRMDTTDPGNDAVSINSDRATIQITAVNDDPFLLQDNNLVENSYIYPDTVWEGEIYTFDAVGISVDDLDIGDNQLIFNIYTNHGIMNFAEVDTTRFISGNNSNTVTIVSTINFVNSYLSLFTYEADQYFTGYDTLYVRLNDQGKTGLGGGDDIFRDIRVYVAPQNFAPELNTSVNHRLRTILEDDIDNSGTLISYILTEDSVIDYNDIIPPNGIAVCAVNNSNGMWQYSLDDGFSFINVSELEGVNVELENEALLLDGDLAGGERNRLRFIPNQDFSGSAEIEFRAWDKSEYLPGEFVDANINGGYTSLSMEKDDAIVYVSNQNDTPELFWSNQQVQDSLFFITPMTSPFNYHFTIADSIFVADSDIAENLLLLTLQVNQGILLFNDPNRFISDNGTNSVSIAGDLNLVNQYLSDFRYMAEANASGMETITITIDDLRTRNQVTKLINFQVTNSAPVYDSEAQATAPEDSEFTFLIETSDADGNPVAITSEQLPEWLSLEDQHDGTALLTGTPINENVGIVTLTFIAADYYTTTAQNFQLLVENTNDNPELISEIPDFSNIEDFVPPLVINLDNYFFDEDVEDVLVYEVQNDELHLHPVLTGSILTISPVLNWFGTTEIIVIADDEISQDTVSDTFTVVLSPVNDIPAFTSTPVLTAVEDLEYVYEIDLIDVDNSEIVISVSLLPDWLQFEVTGDFSARISGTPLNENVGMNAVTIIADDGMGDGSAVHDFVIEVVNTNDAPQLLQNIHDYSVSEDFEESIVLELTDYFYDEDADDVLQYALVYNEEAINCSILNSQLIISSVLNWNGVVSVLVSADDGSIEEIRSTISDQFQISIQPVNDIPVFTSNPILTVNEDTEYFYTIITQDVDTNTTLQLTAEILPDWLQLNVTGNGIANLVGTPLNENVGINPVKLKISDGQSRLTSVQEFDLEVFNTNDAPILIEALEDLNLWEDFSDPVVIELNNFFNDEDITDTLEFSVVYNSNELTAQIHGSILNITSVLNWNGSTEIVVTASDNLENISDNMMINISSVNDAPFVKEAILDFSFDEDSFDTRINLAEVFDDADLIYGDELSFSYESSINFNIELSEETAEVTLTPIPNWFGVEELVFRAEDLAGEIVRDSVIVTIDNINDAPESSLPELLTIQEDELLTVNFEDYISDIDSEHFTIIPSGNSRLEIIVNDLFAEIKGDENWSGSELVSFSINDNDNRAVITDEVTITVEAVNDAPEVQNHLSDLQMFEDLPDNSINLNNTFTDVDFEYGDELTLGVIENEFLEAIIAPETGDVILIPLPDWFGVEELIFTATDLAGAVVADTVIVTVVNINDSPLSSLPELITFDEDETLSLDFSEYIYDADSDPLIISYSGNSHINIVVTDMLVEFIPEADWNGAEVVLFEISDGRSRTSIEADMQIIVNSVNDAPTIANPIQDFSFDEDTVFSGIDLNQVFSDEDLDYGDAISFSFSGQNSLSINLQNGLVEITPEPDWFGIETIQFMATDLEDETAIESVEITVNSINDAPIITLPETLIMQEDESLNIDFSSYCVDIDSEDLILSTLAENMINLEISGLMVNVTPEPNWSGQETITFYLSDNENRIEVQDSLLISVSPVNDAPVVGQEIPDFEMFEDESDNRINLYDTFVDYDLEYGDELSYSFTGSTHFTFEIDYETGVVTLIPEPEWSGVETIAFTAIDLDLESVTEAVTITVTAVNDAPTINLPAYFIFNEDESLEKDFNDFVYDVDSGDLTLTVNGTSNIQVDITELNVIFSASENWSGSEVLTFTVSDINTRLYAYGTVEVIIEPVNDDPIVANPLENFSFDEDSINSSINLSNVFSDADVAYGDQLIFSYSGNQNIGLELSEAGQVILTPAAEWSGIETITFFAEDISGAQAEDEVEITVLNVNDAPVIILPESVTFNEDESLSLDFSGYISDIDSEVLTLGYSSSGDISVEIAGSMITLTAPENWSGSEMITFSVDDNSLRSITTDEMLVVVEQVNDLPFVENPLVDFAIDEDSIDTSINLNNTFGDYDLAYGDVLSFSFEAAINFTIEINAEAEVTLTPSVEWYGEEQLTFTAVDLAGEEISDSVLVTVNNVDDAPEIVLPDSFTLEEDDILVESFESYLSDIDSETLYLSVIAGSNIEVIIEGYDVTFIPQDNWCGVEYINFIVSDSLGRSIDYDGVELIVTPINDVPYVAGEIDDIVIAEGNSDDSIDLSEVFSDYDIGYGDQLSFSALVNNHFIVSIAEFTGDVEIWGEENWNGTDSLTFVATDQDSQSVNVTTNITITGVNDAPYVSGEPELLIFDEDTIDSSSDLYDFFIDPDLIYGDSLAFSYTPNNHIEVSINEGIVTLTPEADWTGYTSIEFNAEDLAGLTASLYLTVKIENINDIPAVVNPIEDLIICLDEIKSLNLNSVFADPDNSLSFQILEFNPNHLSLSLYNGFVLKIEPLQSWNGTTSATVRASDGESGRAYMDYTFDITIDPIYNHPEVNPVSAELDFGTVFIGENSTVKQVELVNMGHTVLEINEIIAPEDFYLRPKDENGWRTIIHAFEIPEGETYIVEMILEPSREIDYNDEIIITSNAVINPELVIELNARTQNPKPNAFTPNGDGLNDSFTLSLGVSSSDPISLHIINLNGREIRKIKGVASNPISWDGRDSDGKRCKSSPYLYYIKQNGSRVLRGKLYLVK